MSMRAFAFDPAVGSHLSVTAVSARPVAVGKIVRQSGGGDDSFSAVWTDAAPASDSYTKPIGVAAPVRRRKIVSVGVEMPIPECARRLYGDSATVFGFARETEFFGVLAQNAELDQWFSVQRKAADMGVSVSADVATDVALAQSVGRALVQATSQLLMSHRDAEIAVNRVRQASDRIDRLGNALRRSCPDMFNPNAPSSRLSSISTRPIGAVNGIDLRMPFDLTVVADRAAGRAAEVEQVRVEKDLWAAIAADFNAAEWPVSDGGAP